MASPLDTIHYERNLITRIQELERRLNALERTELSGVVGPQGPTGATGAQGPDGAGSPSGAVQGDIVYYDATPEAAALNIGTAEQVLRVNAGATAPEWSEIDNDSIANRTRTLFVPATECENTTDGTYENQVMRGWEMVDGKECRCYGAFRCPADYASGMTVDGIFESPSGGDVRVAIGSYYASNGEAYTTHSFGAGAGDETIVADTNDSLTTPPSLGSVTTGDYVICQFVRYGAHANDTISDTLYFVGFLVSYTADM